MTFSGFLENQAGVGRNLSAGPTTGLGETISSSFDFTWKAHTTAAAIQYQGMPLNERNDQIKQRFGQDIYDITGLRKKYTNPSAEGRVAMAKEANDLIDDWITKGRIQEPERYAGIKTSAEIREEARKTVNISEAHMKEVMARNPSSVSRMTGGFIGGAGATLLDPPNLLTLPLGAGPVQGGLKGFAAARAILKAAVIDGTINAGVEAISQPAIMSWQKELGRRYGFGDAVENVALAFAGGSGLSAALRGLSRGINYAGSVSADVLDKIARSEKLPASVRDAASFMSRQAHIDEALPEGMIKTGEDLKVHRDTAQKVADEFENYRPPAQVKTPQFKDQATRADTSVSDRSSASSEKGAEGSNVDGTQDLPSNLTDFPSSFVTPKIDPSSLKANRILGTIDATSQSTIYHTTKKVDNLLKKASALLPELDQLTTRLSQAIDGLEAYPGRVKTKESLAAKVKKKGRGPETMPDILGGRLVADSPKAIYDAVDALGAMGRVLEVDDKLARGSGYRAVHVIMATDKGISAEIQIQPREIRDVQDIAHEKYYKKWDDFDGSTEKIAAAGRLDEYYADMKAQDKLFADAWAKWEARTGQGSEDMTDISPTERIQPVKMPEGLTPEASADRVAIAESDMKNLVDEIGDETITLDDGRAVSIKDFAEEIQAKKAVIEAMKTCRIA